MIVIGRAFVMLLNFRCVTHLYVRNFIEQVGNRELLVMREPARSSQLIAQSFSNSTRVRRNRR